MIKQFITTLAAVSILATSVTPAAAGEYRHHKKKWRKNHEYTYVDRRGNRWQDTRRYKKRGEATRVIFRDRVVIHDRTRIIEKRMVPKQPRRDNTGAVLLGTFIGLALSQIANQRQREPEVRYVIVEPEVPAVEPPAPVASHELPAIPLDEVGGNGPVYRPLPTYGPIPEPRPERVSLDVVPSASDTGTDAVPANSAPRVIAGVPRYAPDCTYTEGAVQPGLPLCDK